MPRGALWGAWFTVEIEREELIVWENLDYGNKKFR